MSGFTRSPRVTIADVAKEAGVSISTVDRVINRRAPVRGGTAEHIFAVAERLGFRAAGVIKEQLKSIQPRCTLGFLLQEPNSTFYRGLGHALEDATADERSIHGRARVHYMDDISPEAVSEQMKKMATEVDALAIHTADHPLIRACVEDFAESNIPVFALITDLSSPVRAGYVGLDSRRKGRTAGWFMSFLAREPGPVAIFVGSHRIQCQELCEMSFRSYLREYAPDFEVLEPVFTMEDERVAREGMRNILRRHPNLVGYYVVGSGVEGVINALDAEGIDVSNRQVIGIGHELTQGTKLGLARGRLHVALSHPVEALAKEVVSAMAKHITREITTFQRVVLPFCTDTPEGV